MNRAKGKIKDAVIDLDTKEGTRLYSLAPFLLLFLDLEAEACEAAVMNPAVDDLKGNGEAVLESETEPEQETEKESNLL